MHSREAMQKENGGTNMVVPVLFSEKMQTSTGRNAFSIPHPSFG